MIDEIMLQDPSILIHRSPIGGGYFNFWSTCSNCGEDLAYFEYDENHQTCPHCGIKFQKLLEVNRDGTIYSEKCLY